MKTTKSDLLWLDEYAKRKLMGNIYGAASMAFTWSMASRVVKLLLDRSAGEDVSYHRTRTPALITGLTIAGLGLSYLLYDQRSATERMEAQRLARRIGLNAKEQQADESRLDKLPAKVQWRHVLTPGGRSMLSKVQKLSPQDKDFERVWNQKYMIRAMKADILGSVQYGALYALLPFVLSAVLAKSNGAKVIYRHPQTTILAAALLTAGSLTQRYYAGIWSEVKLLSDNYQAREIAGIKGQSHDGASDFSSLFTGKEDQKDNPFAAYDRKWLKENANARANMFILNSFTDTIFFGAITTAANMMLTKAAGEAVEFNPLQGSAVFAGTMALGGSVAYLASRAQAIVHKQEDDRLAMRISGQVPDKNGNVPEPGAKSEKTEQSHYWQEKMTKKSDEAKEPQGEALHDDIAPPEDFEAYDKEWLKKYQSLSFTKGLYNALAGATFFGMFSIMAGMLLDKVGNPKKKINFRFPQSPAVMVGMSAIGVYFAYLSNVKESLLRKLEDDRLAHRIKAGEEMVEEKISAPEEGGKSERMAHQKKAWPGHAEEVENSDKWRRRVASGQMKMLDRSV